jgi:hypothetical protein
MIDPINLHLDASYSYRTYAGCLEGCPSSKSCIKKAQDEAVSLWGERTTLLIKPTIKGDRLPAWTHLVWASGPPLSEDGHGSELVIIWWSEFSPDTQRVLQSIPWEKNAKDFQV